jgi:SET domain-containing protein
MFRVDDDYVVDATMSGCLARYINHSCEVNKYSKFVAILLLFFFQIAKFNSRSGTN